MAPSDKRSTHQSYSSNIINESQGN